MNLDEEIFKSLHRDLEVCRNFIKQIAQGMINQAVSNYPIFIAARGENDIDLGLPIVNRSDFDISWNFNASHLEEFVSKGIVLKEKANEFIKSYKNPAEFMCVFVAEENNASFIFMPYVKNITHLN